MSINVKRMISALVGMAMLFALAVPAFAAEPVEEPETYAESSELSSGDEITPYATSLCTRIGGIPAGGSVTITFDCPNLLRNDVVLNVSAKTGEGLTSKLHMDYSSVGDHYTYNVTGELQPHSLTYRHQSYGTKTVVLHNVGNNFITYYFSVKKI